MDGSETALQLVRLCKDQSLEILLVVYAFQAHAIPNDCFLTEPKLTIFVLQHGEEVTQAFDRNQVLHGLFTGVFLAASNEPANDN